MRYLLRNEASVRSEAALNRSVIKPPLELAKPAYNPLLNAGIRLLAPWYRRRIMGVREYSLVGESKLLQAIRDFQTGRSRLALTFHHPNALDPQCVYYMLSNAAARAARRHGKELKDTLHAHFVYGRGVPLWAGKGVEWLLPRVGAVPVYRRTLDTSGIRFLRSLFVEGRFPLAMAPEGQVNYHNHYVSDLELGAARLAFWCLDVLGGRDGGCEVTLLPVTPVYSFPGEPARILNEIYGQISTLIGEELPKPIVDAAGSGGGPDTVLAFERERLLTTAEAVLDVIERTYRRYSRVFQSQVCLRRRILRADHRSCAQPL